MYEEGQLRKYAIPVFLRFIPGTRFSMPASLYRQRITVVFDMQPQAVKAFIWTWRILGTEMTGDASRLAR